MHIIHVIHSIHIQLCMIFLLIVTLEDVLLCFSIGDSNSHQFSLISIMLLGAVQWNLCIMDTLEPFISVLIIKIS